MSCQRKKIKKKEKKKKNDFLINKMCIGFHFISFSGKNSDKIFQKIKKKNN